jgi:hypothetical protein
MEHEAPAIFVALEASDFALGIRKSLWLYPAANIGHIVALVCFVGGVTVMDVRLLGGFHETAPGRVIARARRFAVFAFLGMAITGFMLFAAEASHLAVNPVFLVKLALIGAGLANIAIYEFGAKHAVEGLAPATAMPASAKFAGLLSLSIWLAVAACGRSIAYAG